MINTMTDRQIAEWIVETVLLFGGSVSTAYRVAGLFVEGVRGHNRDVT